MKKASRSHCAAVQRRQTVALIGAGMLACPLVGRASTFTWDGGDSSHGYFSAGDNWVGNVAPPTSGADLIFGATNTFNSAPFADSPYIVNSITFNSSAYSYTGSHNLEANALTIGVGGISDQATSSEAISNAVVLGASQTWNIAAGQLLLSNNTLTNSSSSTLTRIGVGTLNLALSTSTPSGIAAISLTGGTTQISSGTLALNITGTTLNLAGSTLNLSGGAIVNANANGFLSLVIDSASTANVTGSGTQFNALGGNAEIDVARSASGTLNVSNLGNVSSASYLVVGGFNSGNTGTLNVNSGGTVTAPYPLIGFKPGSTGNVLVSGLSSTLNATSNLEMSGNTIGGTYGGTSNLTISNAGTVDAAVTTFYSNASTLNISGGTLNTAGLNSNASGNGAILLADPASGYALNLNGSSGTYSYSGSISGTGTLNKSGGSTQIISGAITGSDHAIVNGGALVLNHTGSLANILVDSGVAQISGGNLSLAGTTASLLVVSGSASAVNISAGAVVNTSSGNYIEVGLDGGATITVTGSGSQLNDLTSNGVYVGGYSGSNLLNISTSGSFSSAGPVVLGGNYLYSAIGTMNISSGATATAPMVLVGSDTGSLGFLNVTGMGSVLNVTANLEIGGQFESGQLLNGNGSVIVSSNGVITAALTTFYSTSAKLNISGGTLNTGGLSSYSGGYGSISLTDPSGGYALNINDVNAAHSNTYSGIISGTGSLNKSGGSTQTLSGNNTFTGPVLVTGGTLNLTGSNQFAFANISGGTLSLGTTGSLAGGANVNVYTGGTFEFTNAATTIGTVNLSGGTLLSSTNNANLQLNKIVVGAAGGAFNDITTSGQTDVYFSDPGPASR